MAQFITFKSFGVNFIKNWMYYNEDEDEDEDEDVDVDEK